MVRKTTKKGARKPAKRGGRSVRDAKKIVMAPKAEKGAVVLQSRPCIKTIAELRDNLSAAKSESDDVVIDAESVESIDMAVLQLLTAFTLSMRRHSASVSWQRPSSEFRELATLAGLGKHLKLDAEIDDADDTLCPVF